MSKEVLTLSASAKEQFLSGDEGRGAIRRTAAELFPNAESVEIVDEEGNLFDTVSGSESTGGAEPDDRAVVLTDAQLEEKRLSEALIAADMSRIEAEVRPQVYASLKDEARQELRGEYRDMIRGLTVEKSDLSNKVSRLQSGMAASDMLLKDTREELSHWKQKFNELSLQYESLKSEQSK